LAAYFRNKGSRPGRETVLH